MQPEIMGEAEAVARAGRGSASSLQLLKEAGFTPYKCKGDRLATACWRKAEHFTMRSQRNPLVEFLGGGRKAMDSRFWFRRSAYLLIACSVVYECAAGSGSLARELRPTDPSTGYRKWLRVNAK